jgi:hypothetical protein
MFKICRPDHGASSILIYHLAGNGQAQRACRLADTMVASPNFYRVAFGKL